MRNKLLLCFFILLLAMITLGSVNVWAETYGNYNYTYDSNTRGIEIISCNKQVSGNIVIPSEINGYPVTIIRTGAFENCVNLTGVVIPDSVKYIRQGAFRGCSKLKDINIPQGVEKIVGFEYCVSLERITLPDSVKYIGDGAFRGCSKLKDINIPQGVEEIGYWAFEDCVSLENIALPDSVKYIGGAFSGCSNLKNINIPHGVGEIVGFEDCVSLENIALPDSVKYIRQGAFRGCSKLKDINIPQGVEEIGYWAFEDCVSLERITLPDSVKYIGYGAFSRCSKLKDINIPQGVEEIVGFEDCVSLERITLPDSVKYIGGCAFEGCNNLKNINIPQGVEEIGYCAFEDCVSLESIELPNSVTYIGEGAFWGCSNLSGIRLSDGLKEIGKSAFYECGKLSSVTIPDSVTRIGKGAFQLSVDGVYISSIEKWCDIEFDGYVFGPCDNFYINNVLTENIIIPNGITEIKDYTFSGFGCIKSVILPESVMKIGEGAFGETDISTITLPAGITSIEESAFEWCDYLTDVYFKGSAAQWSEIEIMEYNDDLLSANIHFLNEDTSQSYKKYYKPDKYTFHFGALKNVNITVNGKNYNTGNSCVIKNIRIPDNYSGNIIFSADGYHTYEMDAKLLVSYSQGVNWINLSKNDNSGNPVFMDVRHNNLQVLSYSSYMFESLDESGVFYADVNWQNHKVGKIYLQQGNNHDSRVYLENKKSKRIIPGKYFKHGAGDIYICAETDGKTYRQKLRLSVRKSSINADFDYGKEISIKTAGKEDWLQSCKFDFDLGSEYLPVSIEVRSDNTFYGTIGVSFVGDNKSSQPFIYEDIKNAYKTKKNFDIQRVSNYCSKPHSANIIAKCDMKVVGYIEGKLNEGSDDPFEITETGLVGCASGGVGFGNTYFAGPVPVQWNMMIDVSLKTQFSTYKSDSEMIINPFEIEGAFNVEAGAGVGVSHVATCDVIAIDANLVLKTQVPFDEDVLKAYLDGAFYLGKYDVLGFLEGSLYKKPFDKVYLYPYDYEEENVSLMTSDEDTLSTLSSSCAASGFVANSQLSLADLSKLSSQHIVSGAYISSRPQLAKLDNGTEVIVWVEKDDESLRPVASNQAAIYYSVCMPGGVWSEPTIVEQDYTADQNPSLTTIDGNIYLLWMNSNTVFEKQDASIEEVAASMDISYAKFDAENLVFTDIARVASADDYLDMMPEVQLVYGSPIVVYVKNTGNSVFCESGETSIRKSQLIDGAWCESTVCTDLQPVDGLCIGKNGEVYFSQDTDNDLTTVDDKEIFTAYYWLYEQVTSNETADTKPTVINGVVYWYRDGELVSQYGDSIDMHTYGDRYQYVSNGYNQAIVYSQSEPGKGLCNNIYAIIKEDGIWSAPVKITENASYTTSFDALIGDDNVISVITNERKYDEELRLISNDIYLHKVADYIDVSIVEAGYNPYSLIENGKLEINSFVKNNGTEAVNKIYVNVSDGETDLGSKNINVKNILPGETAQVDFYCSVPTSASVIYISVTTDDAMTQSQVYELKLRTNDVSVENGFIYLNENQKLAEAQVYNRGFGNLNNVSVNIRKDSSNGEILLSQTIDSIECGKVADVSFDITSCNSDVYYITIDELENENILTNNSFLLGLSEAEDYETEVISAYTSSVVNKTDAGYIASTELHGLSADYMVIAATYKDGKLVGFEKRKCANDSEDFILNPDGEVLKIIVFNNLAELYPVCNCETISYK